MLSRTADSLFWLARYLERAENVARMLDVTWRMSLMPRVNGADLSDWSSALLSAAQKDLFDLRYDEANARNVIHFLGLDAENPSSIHACVRKARENARELPGAVTAEMWESVNDTWFAIKDLEYTDVSRNGFHKFFDLVQGRAHLFRGVTYGTMLQDDAYQFLRLGWFLERAGNTARILDVNYHALLPTGEPTDGAVDYHRWAALLRSVSAFKAYRRLYRQAVAPRGVAEFLVLCEDMPRSLHACYREIDSGFARLRFAYGSDLECYRLGGELYARLKYGRIDDVLRRGLHGFLVQLVRDNETLGAEIAHDFLMEA